MSRESPWEHVVRFVAWLSYLPIRWWNSDEELDIPGAELGWDGATTEAERSFAHNEKDHSQGSRFDCLACFTFRNHSLCGAAYTARMYGDNPELSPDAVKAYRWAEAQFNRIGRGEVGENDLIG